MGYKDINKCKNINTLTTTVFVVFRQYFKISENIDISKTREIIRIANGPRQIKTV